MFVSVFSLNEKGKKRKNQNSVTLDIYVDMLLHFL